MRMLRWAASATLVLLLIALATLAALGSDRATRALLSGATALSGGQLEFGAVHGNLRQGLRLEQVRLRLDGIDAQATMIDWQPGDGSLARRELALGRLTLDELHVSLDGDDTPSTQPARLPALALPGRITLQSLELRGLTIAAAGGTPLRLETVRLSGSLEGSRLRLDRLFAEAGQAVVDAALRLEFAGEGALDGWLQGTLRQPDGPPLRLHGAVGGSLVHGVQATLYTTEPGAARLAASLDRPLEAGPWQAHLWLERESLARWRSGLPPWLLAAQARARGHGARLAVSVDYRLEQTPAGDAHGRIAAQGTGEQWDVTAEAGADAAKVTLAGAVDLGTSSVDAQLDWQALQWPLADAPPRVQSPRGSARLTGRIDDWALSLQAALAAQGQSGELNAQARGDSAQARLESFEAQLLGGRLNGEGELRWAPDLRYAVSARARALDPGLLNPQWQGRVDADISAAGDAGTLDLKLAGLGGTLRDQPLRGEGALTWRPESLRLDAVDLRLGQASLGASGNLLGAGAPLVLVLTVPAAGDLLPGARGRLRANARINGPDFAQASVELTVAGLAWGGQAVDAVDARLELDRPQDRLSVRVDANGIRIGERRVSLNLDADGAASDHAVRMNVAHDDLRLTLSGQGGLLDDGWRGRIKQGALAGLPPQDWTLAEPLALELRQSRQSVARHCWQAGTARLCADGHSGGGAMALSAELQALPLAPLVALAHPDLAADSRLDGRVSLHRNADPLQGELRLTVSPGALVFPMPDGRESRFAHGGARVDGRLESSGGNLEVQLAQAAPTQPDLLSARLRLPPLPATADAPLQGSLTAQLPDVGLFAPWLAQLDELAGRIEAAMQVDGTVGAPRLVGEAHLREGRAAVPALGIELHQMQARLTGDGSDTLRLEGSAQSGDGTLRLAGFGRQTAAGPQVRLTLGGERVEVFDTAQLQARISPKLDIELSEGRLAVTGEITVPTARIRAPDRPAAIQTSEDVVVSGREAADSRSVAANVDLRVVLGDDVRVDAYGFRGQLGGAVRVQQLPDGAAAVNGQVKVTEGQYSFYGQRLGVTEGELRYAGGPPDNPALRITASRKAGDVTAGIRLRGTARAPTTQLFSTPAMPQADILSYLVIGRPMQQARGGEGDLLMQAAGSAALRGGNALVKRLGQTLGFDDAKLGGDGNGGASLALGRHLTPRLYVGYGLALADQANAVTLRYTVTEQWLLEVVSGLTQTADLLYQIER